MFKKQIIVSVFTVIALSFLGCSKDENPTQPPEADPTFVVSSIPQVCTNDVPCLQFFVTPNTDVILIKVEIKPPVGSSTTYNLGSDTYIKDAPIAMQDEGKAYTKISGTWSFIFTGNKAAGSKKSFVVTAKLPVSA
jgi:hypothetical protein